MSSTPELNITGFSWDFAIQLKKACGHGEGSLLSHPTRRAVDIETQVAFIRSNIKAGNRVLEIGTNCGHFTYLVMLLNVASVVTIELRPECKPAIGMLLERYDRIEPIFGDSSCVVPRLPGSFDVVWIDGSHEESHALNDLRNCAGITKLILVDDSQIRTVKNAIAEFVAESDFELDSVCGGKRTIAKLVLRKFLN